MALGTAVDLRGAERRTLDKSGVSVSKVWRLEMRWRTDSGVNLVALTVMMYSFCGVSDCVIAMSSEQRMKLKQLGS